MKRTGTCGSVGVLFVVMVLVLLVGGCELRFQDPFSHPADNADTDIFDDDSDDDNNGSNVTPVPFRTVVIGQPGAWDGIEPVITGSGHNEIGGPGTDISAIYIAHDDRYVYWRMDVADDAPQINNYGYKLWGAQPDADHRIQYAIEAHAVPVLDGTDTQVTQLRADLEWESYGNAGDYDAHTSTYVEMKFPLEHVRFNPLAVAGEILSYDEGRSATTDWRTVQFDLSGHRPANRISLFGHLAGLPILIEEEYGEVDLFEDGTLRIRARSIAPESSGEIVDLFFQTGIWQEGATYTMPELGHEATAGTLVGSPIIEAAEGFYGWAVAGASDVTVGRLRELYVEADFYLEHNGGETITGWLAVWFPYQ